MATTTNEDTALMRAAHDGNVKIVKYLVDNGADINIKNDCGDTALLKSVESRKYRTDDELYRSYRNNCIAVSKYLIDVKLATDPKEDQNYMTIIQRSICAGDTEIARYLIEKGIKLHFSEYIAILNLTYETCCTADYTGMSGIIEKAIKNTN